jgi:hypothetical protein
MGRADSEENENLQIHQMSTKAFRRLAHPFARFWRRWAQVIVQHMRITLEERPFMAASALIFE